MAGTLPATPHPCQDPRRDPLGPSVERSNFKTLRAAGCGLGDRGWDLVSQGPRQPVGGSLVEDSLDSVIVRSCPLVARHSRVVTRANHASDAHELRGLQPQGLEEFGGRPSPGSVEFVFDDRASGSERGGANELLCRDVHPLDIRLELGRCDSPLPRTRPPSPIAVSSPERTKVYDCAVEMFKTSETCANCRKRWAGWPF